jgi:hypothetical protein
VKHRLYCSSTTICFLLISLLSFLPRIAAGQVSTFKTAVVFYSDPQVEESLWPALVDAFHNEVLEEQSEYPLPENFEPIRASALSPGQDFEHVIEVHLIGRCDVVQQAYRPIPRGPLGWVLKVSGEIQPFIFVDCARLSQFLNPTTLGMSDQQRSEAMARAISRVAIHEWIHIDAQTARHENHGIRQGELSTRDLTMSSPPSGGR